MRKENTCSAFTRALSRHLKDRDVAQVDLARLVGRSEAAVSRWVNGEGTPSAKVIERVAARLGLTLAEFYAVPDGAPEAA